jgi:hypothetical protein
MKLHVWKDLLWGVKAGRVYAYCPVHRIELDLRDKDGDIYAQHAVNASSQYAPYLFVCPSDSAGFSVPGGLASTARRRFAAALESLSLRDAEIVDLDGYQVPIAKAKPDKKDDTFWVEARINETKRGKQVVIYAGERGASDKSQIFIDSENEKITFDQNNIHPNDVFTKVVADFKSGKKATLEDGKQTTP